VDGLTRGRDAPGGCPIVACSTAPALMADHF
jgi:hypothetical protein